MRKPSFSELCAHRSLGSLLKMQAPIGGSGVLHRTLHSHIS